MGDNRQWYNVVVVDDAQQRWFQTFQAMIPDLPTHEVDGQIALAPADSFANKRNVENPELYAIFPFRRIAFNRPHNK